MPLVLVSSLLSHFHANTYLPANTVNLPLPPWVKNIIHTIIPSLFLDRKKHFLLTQNNLFHLCP